MSGAGCTSRGSINRRPRQARHSSDRNRRRCSCRHPVESMVCSSPADGQLQARPLMPRRSARRGSTHVASDRGCEHAVPLGDAECLGGSARHGGDADSARRATGHRRARWDGRANLRAPTTGLAAPGPGREADSAADGRSGAGQSRHLGQGPPRRRPRPRHHSARFRSPPGVVSGWGCGWHTDPAC